MPFSWEIIYSIEDEKQAISDTTIKVPSTTALPNVLLFAAQMSLLINPLIRGAIRRIGVSLTLDLPAGLRTAPLTQSDREEGARFQMATAGGFDTSLRLPTFDESFILPNSRNVDLADPTVAAFVAALTGGINLTPLGGTGTVQPTDYRDDDITTVTSAIEQFVKSRGG